MGVANVKKIQDELVKLGIANDELRRYAEVFKKYSYECENEIHKLRDQLEKFKWQPIETAPRDGTQLILSTIRENAPYPADNGRYLDIGRWTDHNAGGWVRYTQGEPTHWMPKPDPPKEGE